MNTHRKFAGAACVAALCLAACSKSGSVDLPALAEPPVAAEPGRVTIVRDTYGVPHIYGATGEDVAYAAGYAQAQDRLWQLHLFRLLGKGHSSDLFGGITSPIDRLTHFFTYTKPERERQFASTEPRVRSLIQAYIDGINAWLGEVRADLPGKLPQEFVDFQVGIPPEWTTDDFIAFVNFLVFANGAVAGGSELEHAALLAQLIEQHGAEQGRAMFDDLVPVYDPDAEPTVPPDYDYLSAPTGARDAEVNDARRLTIDARLSLPASQKTLSSIAPPLPALKGTLPQLSLIPDMAKALEGLAAIKDFRASFRFYKPGSNMVMAGPQHSLAGGALATHGSQVGWQIPALLYDWGLHSDDGVYDVSGETVPAAGPLVVFGSGKGYFFSGTTGFSDLLDTYVVKLGPEPKTYLYNGQVERMECRTETYALHGVPFETQEVCRTRHGPVLSFDEPNGVAYAYRAAWFNRDHQLMNGAVGWQSAKSLEDYASNVMLQPTPANNFYVDDQGNYAYWHSANVPIRSPGIDPRLPQDGSGGSEWLGLVPVQQMPRAINAGRGWLASWNNLPAKDWPGERAFTPVKNLETLHHALNPATAKPDPDGGAAINPDGRFDFEDMNAVLRYAAFKSHVHTSYSPFLPAAAELSTDLARRALATLKAWDGFRNDPDGDGNYHAGLDIVDTWVAKMREGAFRDEFPRGFAGAEHPFWWLVRDLYAEGGVLWHVLNPADQLPYRYDWLNGETPAELAARAFEAATVALAAKYGSQDPESWRIGVYREHYVRFTPDLYTDFATAGPDDSGVPGDVRDPVYMDRGTANGIISYLASPNGSGVLGQAPVQFGSALPPGQSGFISLAGEEAPHFEDQLDLYENWQYKPVPMTLAEARAIKESEITLIRPGVAAPKARDPAGPDRGGGGVAPSLLLLLLAVAVRRGAEPRSEGGWSD